MMASPFSISTISLILVLTNEMIGVTQAIATPKTLIISLFLQTSLSLSSLTIVNRTATEDVLPNLLPKYFFGSFMLMNYTIYNLCFNVFAGFPTTMVLSSTGLVTTLPAPTKASLPICFAFPLISTEHWPMKAFVSTSV